MFELATSCHMTHQFEIGQGQAVVKSSPDLSPAVQAVSTIRG